MNPFQPANNMPGPPSPTAAPQPPGGADPDDPPRQPPIGIIHLLTWTAGSAVILGVDRWFSRSDGAFEGYATFFAIIAWMPAMSEEYFF